MQPPLAFIFYTSARINSRLVFARPLRWYISFGKHAARAGAGETGEIVTMAFVKSSGVSGSAAARSGAGAASAARRGVVDILAAGAGTAAAAAALAASVNAASPSRAGARGAAPLYGWEADGGAPPDPLLLGGGGGGGARGGDGMPPGPLTLPNGMLEFQVRLTADEHAKVALARRRAEAEAKYCARVHAAAAGKRGDRAAAADAEAARAADTGPYEDQPRTFQRSP